MFIHHSRRITPVLLRPHAVLYTAQTCSLDLVVPLVMVYRSKMITDRSHNLSIPSTLKETDVIGQVEVCSHVSDCLAHVIGRGIPR